MWELFAQTAVVRLLQILQLRTIIISDCKAAVARSNEILCSTSINPQSNGSTTLLLSTHTNRPPSNTRFIWFPSHPERHDLRRNHPSPFDKAIYVADRVAEKPVISCVLGPYTTPVNTISTISTDVLKVILPQNLWYISPINDDTFPILTDYLQYQYHYQHETFVQQRDKDAQFYKNSYWQSTFFNLSNSLRPLKSYNYWKAARRTQILYDWVAHGRQREKMEKDNEKKKLLRKCVLCSNKDKQEHLIFECTYPPLIPTRQKILTSLKNTANPLLKSTNPLIKKFTQRFIVYASRCHSTFTRRLWLGLWSKDLLEILFKDILPNNLLLSLHQINDIRSTIRTLSRPLWRGYIKLVKAAQLAQGISVDNCKFKSITKPLRPQYQRHLSTTHSSKKSSKKKKIPTFHNINDNRLDITNIAFLLPDSDSDTTASDTTSNSSESDVDSVSDSD